MNSEPLHAMSKLSITLRKMRGYEYFLVMRLRPLDEALRVTLGVYGESICTQMRKAIYLIAFAIHVVCDCVASSAAFKVTASPGRGIAPNLPRTCANIPFAIAKA